MNLSEVVDHADPAKSKLILLTGHGENSSETYTFGVKLYGVDGRGRKVFAGTVRYPSFYPGPKSGFCAIVVVGSPPFVMAMHIAESNTKAVAAALHVVATGRQGYGPSRTPMLSWNGRTDSPIHLEAHEDL